MGGRAGVVVVVGGCWGGGGGRGARLGAAGGAVEVAAEEGGQVAAVQQPPHLEEAQDLRVSVYKFFDVQYSILMYILRRRRISRRPRICARNGFYV